MNSYSYDKACDIGRLGTEITQSSVITKTLDHIDSQSSPQQTTIWFDSPLTDAERVHLDNLIIRHLKTIKDSVIVDIQEIDVDGAQIVRLKAAKKGWTYCATPIEFQTSRLSDTLYSKLVDGTSRPGITMKSYNAQDQEVITPGLLNANYSTIVKTVIDFEPNHDYEIIGGFIRTINDITADIRIWIIAVPDIPSGSGGSKEMVGGLNLNYMKPENTFFVDGRVTKMLPYNESLHTNKLRFVLKYPAGANESIVINLEYYKE